MSLSQPPTDDQIKEHGLQIATRFVALLRTGRSYAVGNLAFTRQLEHMLQVLEPLAAATGSVELIDFDGDLYVNGARLPLRTTIARQLEQLQQELALRGLAGIAFHEGLPANELEGFMRYFLSSEMYKGAELVNACATQGLRYIVPALQVAAQAQAVHSVLPAGSPSPSPTEYLAAVHAYEQALAGARLLLARGRLSAGVQLRHAKRVAQPLVDAAVAGQPLNAALAWVRRAPTPAWTHALHVALVAIATAERMGCPRRILAQVGVAALLHDTGHEAMAGSGSPSTWTPEERALIAQHPTQGMRRIAASSPFDRTTLFAMQVAMTHHAGQDAPLAEPSASSAEHVALVAIADAYVTLLAACDPTALTLTPYETLGRVLGPLSGRFSAPLRAALVEAVGVHPPGQMVRLDDGSVARVLANTPGLPTDPYVELLTEPSGRVRDDAGQGAITLLPEGRAIARALPLNEWPVFSQAA